MPNNQQLPETILGLDFGMKRIGVAVGQTITQTASALTTLKAQDGVPDWNEIKQLIDNWHIQRIVVGLPYNMDGTQQSITYAAKRFANKLHHRFRLPVALIDERLTTKAAKQSLKEQGYHPEKLDNIDSYAAKLILESWLSTHALRDTDA